MKTLKFFGRKNRNLSKIKKLNGKNFYTEKEIQDAFIRSINILGPKIRNLNKTQPLEEFITDQKDLDIITKVFKIVLPTADIPPDEVGITAQNMAFICERILALSSTPKSLTKYNFYKMFFDKVLAEYQILYAMPTINRKNGDRVKFKYLSSNNWIKEYEMVKKAADQKYLQLRGKSGTNKVNDAIGVNV